MIKIGRANTAQTKYSNGCIVQDEDTQKFYGPFKTLDEAKKFCMENLGKNTGVINSLIIPLSII